MDSYKKRVKTILNSLEKLRYGKQIRINKLWRAKSGYGLEPVFSKASYDWTPFLYEENWGGTDHHSWFYTQFQIPKDYEGKKVLVFLHTGANDIWNTDNPQVIAYLDGTMKAAMDMNHTSMELCQNAAFGQEYELAFYAYSNSREKTNLFHMTAATYQENVEKLYYDMKVLWDAADCLSEEEEERGRIFELLNCCVNCLDLRRTDSEEFLRSVDQALDYLDINYYSQERQTSSVTVYSVGHTHIDVAWKWPLRQTREKVVRSFMNVLNLMDKYPEYRFMSSQPQLYQFVKEEAPWVYEKIKEKVLEGRWETEGAMWVEADCNLTSGESLIRQILYGKEFFNEEFGTGEDNRVLWLPDVFGYSVALPQILKKSGISYFMTTKIGWNEVNQIPNDTMMWKGLDGSSILTYFITTSDYCKYPKLRERPSFGTTYNGLQNVSQIMGTWQRYQNKQLSRDVLTCYGYGDGGGGPTAGMLEESRRIAHGVGRCPVTRQTSVREFFEHLEANLEGKKVPVWDGELYLETHRGTYTSMARNKKNNRQCEFLCGEAEFIHVLAKTFDKENEYPTEDLKRAWKLVLLNQFHDILPGSSIKEVYEDSDIQYEEVKRITGDLIQSGQKRIIEKIDGDEPVMAVFNLLGFARTSLLQIKGDTLTAKNPGLFQETWDGQLLYRADNVSSKGIEMLPLKEENPYGDSVITWVKEENGRVTELQTSHYDIRLNETGEFSSIFDRKEGRELISANQAGNRLVVFEDRPAEYDAWNIDSYYEEKSWIVDDVKEINLLENGKYRACLYIKRQFLESELKQYIYFYNHTCRIDFETQVEWKEQQLLLKTMFPVDIHGDKARYEVQFGSVERPTHRNTSWEAAKFEVCGHKWADLSEYGYGVALLNDCKYGYNIHNSVMWLTLIKSGIFPYSDADKGHHHFTYSIYPHCGDYRQGRVVQEAYDLNCPLYGGIVKGIPGYSNSYLTVRDENVFADTIKQAEDGNGVIVRLYEAYGKRTKTKLYMPQAKGRTVLVCDCMEKGGDTAVNHQGVLELELKPYEIVTLRII